MNEIYTGGAVTRLKDELWSDTVSGGRTGVLNPLYVERYRGPRNSGVNDRHAYWEFTGVVSGSGLFHAGGEDFLLEESSVILIPPGLPHREQAETGIDTIWLGFEADLPGVSRERALALNSSALMGRLVDFWSFAHHHFAAIGPELDGLLLALTGFFFRQLQDTRRHSSGNMQAVVNYLTEHYHEDIAMAELAEMRQCSVGHFFRRFKEFTGVTPVHYLNSLRIKKAVFYLENTRLKINQIALLCGFKDPYYFSRTFRQFTGRSPAAYRRDAV